VNVLTMDFFVVDAAQSCCVYEVVPSPTAPSGMIEIADCAQNIVPGQGGQLLMDDNVAPPSNPSPADGQTVVPTNTPLSWDTAGWPCFWLGHYNVYFGTSPDPPLFWSGIETSFSPGQLQPATTYYWHVDEVYGQDCTMSSGPSWSFTTEQPVPAMPSTWGAIKALYE
jgi:hypothetical protein